MFCDKETTLYVAQKLIGFMQFILDHKSEKVTKLGARLTKSSQNSLELAFMECQSFQMYLT